MRSQLHTHSGNRERKLPVFVSPEELQFVGEEEASHKQILTVFNPYDFNIRFKVLSNAPHKYSVIESQGAVRAHCCVDLVVCHRLACDGPYDVSDKFKIELFYENRDSRPVGRRQVISTLLKSRPSSQCFDEMQSDFMNVSPPLPSSPLPHTPRQGTKLASLPDPLPKVQSGPGVLQVLAALVCLIILLLPIEGEGPDWPSYLQITVNQKLIAAFALGLLTMAILKS